MERLYRIKEWAAGVGNKLARHSKGRTHGGPNPQQSSPFVAQSVQAVHPRTPDTAAKLDHISLTGDVTTPMPPTSTGVSLGDEQQVDGQSRERPETERVKIATSTLVTGPGHSGDTHPVSPRTSTGPLVNEEPLQRTGPWYQSPYMKIALENLETKDPKLFKSYQQMQDEMHSKFGDTGVGQLELNQVISQVRTVVSAKDAESEELVNMKIKKKILPALGFAKPLIVAIARLDPHQIAPWVVAGVFFALEVPHSSVRLYCYEITQLILRIDVFIQHSPRCSVDNS
jgi:hypothetical protein